MTNAAKQLIDSFEALAAQEQQEVLAQLLRRLTDVEYSPLSDDALLHAADAVSRTTTAGRAQIEVAAPWRGVAV